VALACRAAAWQRQNQHATLFHPRVLAPHHPFHAGLLADHSASEHSRQRARSERSRRRASGHSARRSGRERSTGGQCTRAVEGRPRRCAVWWHRRLRLRCGPVLRVPAFSALWCCRPIGRVQAHRRNVHRAIRPGLRLQRQDVSERMLRRARRDLRGCQRGLRNQSFTAERWVRKPCARRRANVRLARDATVFGWPLLQVRPRLR